MLLALADDVTTPGTDRGHWVIGVAAVSAVLAGRATPTGVIAGLFAAVDGGCRGTLVVGTAAGRVSPKNALALLAAVGVSDIEIQQFSRQSDGVVLIDADSGNDRLLVKMLGRDVAEQRRLLRLWRSLMYRDNGAALASARAPGLERETLATLLADVHGIPVWRVLTAGQKDGSDQTPASSSPTASGHRHWTATSFDAAFAASAWRTVKALHAARFVHLDLAPRSLAVRGDGMVALTDFTDSQRGSYRLISSTPTTPSCSSAWQHWPAADTAVASAHDALGNDELVALLPFLQSAALAAQSASRGQGRRRQHRRAAQGGGRGGRRRRARSRQAAPGYAGEHPPSRAAATRCKRDHHLLRRARHRRAARGVRVGIDPAADRRVRGRPGAPADAGHLDAGFGARADAVRPRLHDAARDMLHERRAAVRRRTHGAQHPVLPAAGRRARHGGRLRRGRLASWATWCRRCCWGRCCSSRI